MRKFEVFEEDLIVFAGQIDHKRGKLFVGEDNIGGRLVYLQPKSRYLDIVVLRVEPRVDLDDRLRFRS